MFPSTSEEEDDDETECETDIPTSDTTPTLLPTGGSTDESNPTGSSTEQNGTTTTSAPQTSDDDDDDDDETDCETETDVEPTNDGTTKTSTFIPTGGSTKQQVQLRPLLMEVPQRLKKRTMTRLIVILMLMFQLLPLLPPQNMVPLHLPIQVLLSQLLPTPKERQSSLPKQASTPRLPLLLLVHQLPLVTMMMMKKKMTTRKIVKLNIQRFPIPKWIPAPRLLFPMEY